MRFKRRARLIIFQRFHFEIPALTPFRHLKTISDRIRELFRDSPPCVEANGEGIVNKGRNNCKQLAAKLLQKAKTTAKRQRKLERVGQKCNQGGDNKGAKYFTSGTVLMLPEDRQVREGSINVVRTAATQLSGFCNDHKIDFLMYVAEAYTTPALCAAKFEPDIGMAYNPWSGTRAVRSAVSGHNLITFIIREA
ncbi:hypothetical protein E8E12_005613 [Didymella heteroderae]|uniref:Uncharacterized protein n=1 Tax=Didymella heteroderae TaxID=1769908 RepID=A0A9P5C1W1_9PLEO|nr:hypothetical protein E8E12_005613 [Didymella heteroderae]